MPAKGKGFLEEYCIRFGRLAVEMGFVSEKQLCWAMELQVREDLRNQPHRVIGQILFEQGWMTPRQIDQVLKRLFESQRAEEARSSSRQPSNHHGQAALAVSDHENGR